jgi:hypothetical protein
VITPSVLARIGEKTSLLYEVEVVRQEAPFDRGAVARNSVLASFRFLLSSASSGRLFESSGMCNPTNQRLFSPTFKFSERQSVRKRWQNRY